MIEEELGVNDLKDLFFIFNEEELLKEVEKSIKKLEFLKFKQSKEFTRAFLPPSNTSGKGQETSKASSSSSSNGNFDNIQEFINYHPELLRRKNDLLYWIEENKLSSNLYEILSSSPFMIVDLPNLLFISNESIEQIITILKPIPGKKFKSALEKTKEEYWKLFYNPSKTVRKEETVQKSDEEEEEKSRQASSYVVVPTKEIATKELNTEIFFPSDDTSLNGNFIFKITPSSFLNRLVL